MERITLNNRYEIIDKVGGGGMAEVFHGFDTLLHRDVGIKILRDQYLQDENFVNKFREEACAAARLSHPNIVNIYDVGQEHGIYYIVMEYVVGKTIKDYINEQGPLSAKRAIKYAIGIASALNQAHQQNLVHCDIKSQNVLIDGKNNAKVTDFGIARIIGQTARQNAEDIMGSVHYLSPEQASGAPVTPKCDLYSLGVVLFEMLTGKLPFCGNTPEIVARQHLESPTPSARCLNPTIPVFLDDIIAKALAKNPAMRYDSALEFLRDLREADELLEEDIDDTKSLSKQMQTERKPDTEECSGATMVIKKTDMLDGLSGHDNTATVKEPPKKFNMKKFVMIFVAIILLACGVIYAALDYSKNTVTVPDLKGKTIVEAEDILTKLKLTYSLSEEYNDEVTPGQVCRQSPPANSRVKEGRKINLVVSKGVEQGVVPNLVGKNINDANNLLKEAKLLPGKVTIRYDKSAPLGSVLEQSIKAKTKVSANTKIDMVVNIEEGQVVVPSISGLTLDEAKAAITASGLQVGSINKVEDSAEANTVLSADPAEGKVLSRGATVNITVSSGKNTKAKDKDKTKDKDKNKDDTKNTSTSQTTTDNTTSSGTSEASSHTAVAEFMVPGSKGKNDVRMVVVNSNGTSTAFQGVVSGGAWVRQQITVAGNTHVQFYVNGNLVEDRKY